jgi:hypothetical protein
MNQRNILAILLTTIVLASFSPSKGGGYNAKRAMPLPTLPV